MIEMIGLEMFSIRLREAKENRMLSLHSRPHEIYIIVTLRRLKLLLIRAPES